ncbi:MAG: YgiQ family radical SAM protein [Candidatus Cloacimonetes bacterium]|nr:YgiQ family radical SAM protein [Candidatus Cloacimonadota bacterium]MCB5286924.1 YgiQ family radical SAM protein [Candidatus Cloacimonadota bacterium]MCK9184134.1 YgiQ family radical SAM protein [Candidatus Cloacimonadota bacterium]MDY0229245.1 YgiQ family radical SAM protein [Candidatus Cloacimonadaceae bacterium]
MPFLPTNKAELQALGLPELDIILISGDAYIDHPSFGTALLGRLLESAGFRVGIIAQPDWSKNEDFLVLGRPRLFFGISSGNMDSMVNHYTAQRKKRNDDAYSPDGQSGKRPDRAVMIYTNIVRRLFKGTPVIIGGIEASLRRIAHYDFWQDKVRNSILADSKADLLIYGMAEKPILEVAEALKAGIKISELTDILSTVCYVSKPDGTLLPDAELCKNKLTFHQMNRLFYENVQTTALYQLNGGRYIKHNPPAEPLTTSEMDKIYQLPYMRAPHPRYAGHNIPAWEQIRQSITSHRGCYGGCNFCAIAIHQGRKIQSRSAQSILSEAKKLPGVISDLGGPSANMYDSKCKLGFPDSCKRRSCLFPQICPNLSFDHDVQIRLLDAVAALPKVKHVFVASGIRHDMALGNRRYISAIAQKYTGGRLKLAPEHSSDSVLKLMGKPSIARFEDFAKQYFAEVNKAGIKRQIIPYIIIGHPGTTSEDALHLKNWLQRNNIKVEQVQEFTPTPMTISTCMYYTGLNFDLGTPIPVPSPGEVRKQKELILGSPQRPQQRQTRDLRKKTK